MTNLTVPTYIADGVEVISSERRRVNGVMSTMMVLKGRFGDRAEFRIFKNTEGIIEVYMHRFDRDLSRWAKEERFEIHGEHVASQNNYDDAMYEATFAARFRL